MFTWDATKQMVADRRSRFLADAATARAIDDDNTDNSDLDSAPPALGRGRIAAWGRDRLSGRPRRIVAAWHR